MYLSNIFICMYNISDISDLSDIFIRQELYFEVSQAKWGNAKVWSNSYQIIALFQNELCSIFSGTKMMLLKKNGVPESTCSKDCPMGMIRNYEVSGKIRAIFVFPLNNFVLFKTHQLSYQQQLNDIQCICPEYVHIKTLCHILLFKRRTGNIKFLLPYKLTELALD